MNYRTRGTIFERLSCPFDEERRFAKASERNKYLSSIHITSYALAIVSHIVSVIVWHLMTCSRLIFRVNCKYEQLHLIPVLDFTVNMVTMAIFSQVLTPVLVMLVLLLLQQVIKSEVCARMLWIVIIHFYYNIWILIFLYLNWSGTWVCFIYSVFIPCISHSLSMVMRLRPYHRPF